MGDVLQSQMNTSMEIGISIVEDIDELQSQGIQQSDINKLRMAGVCTLKGAAMMSRRSLYKIKGLSEAKVDKIKECLNKVVDMSFSTAKAVAQRRRQIHRISTGSVEFDRLLNGGIQSQSITEVFGEFRTGKTQLCHTLCVTSQMGKGGIGNTNTPDLGDSSTHALAHSASATCKCAFIDTEGTFRPDRIREIATRFNLDPETALDNILVARAYNTEQQCELLDRLAVHFSEEPGRYRLLVVDSVISLFRTDYSGRGELGERQQKLNQHLCRLQHLAEEFNIAVLISNQMMADPGGAVSFVADPKKPIGGHVLAHASATRLYLKKGRNETRIARVYDSPEVAEAEAVYSITSGGIADVVE